MYTSRSTFVRTVFLFLKVFVLIYADDTVIFAENATELQIALNAKVLDIVDCFSLFKCSVLL